MIIITRENKVAVSTIKEMAEKMFGNLVKAVVDVKREVMAIDGELHADEEAILMENGSRRADVWGINLYPEFFETDKFVEFDSVINLKPAYGNRTRNVEDEQTRNNILKIVDMLVEKE